MSEHLSLRERLESLWPHHGEPVFEPSGDPVLVAFATIFADSELDSFDANKHLRTDALSPIYDCETESRRSADAEVEKFVVVWSPVWHRDNPVTGFRTGRDSTLLGSTPTVAMPQDERTAALLLLVTTPFVHLSGNRADGSANIMGAFEDEGGNYRFLVLDPAAVRTGASVAPTATSGPTEP